jgi:hypothetical protein
MAELRTSYGRYKKEVIISMNSFCECGGEGLGSSGL